MFIAFNLACKQTFFNFSIRSFKKCLIFLFVMFKNIGELARKKNKYYQLALASINPLRFIFYHSRSKDFEDKIEGL